MATTLTRGKYVLVRADLGGESVVLTDGAVAQTDGAIVDVGTYDDLRGRFPDAEIVGNGRQFLMPGMVNAHHHGRGLSGLLLGQPDGGLETWINHAWGRRGVEPYNMMCYTLLNLIRSGVTTVMFNQSATARRMVWDEAQANLRAFAEAGVRTAFSLAFKNQCYLVYGNDEDVLGADAGGPGERCARDYRQFKAVHRGLSVHDGGPDPRLPRQFHEHGACSLQPTGLSLGG